MDGERGCERRPATWGRCVSGHSALTLAVVLAGLIPAGYGGTLDGLARPQEGRSRRATSTAVDQQGRFAHSNNDNSNVAPGTTKTLLEAQGPGVITHIWFTFLGPERQSWAPQGSANHQEMLLRITYDGAERPGVEAPLGDFFANSFGKRSEVISEPVVVEDADSYNCFWHMPFRESVRIELVNQSRQQISLLYYNRGITFTQVDTIYGGPAACALGLPA